MDLPTQPKRSRIVAGPSTSKYVLQVGATGNKTGPDDSLDNQNLGFIVLLRTFEYLDAVDLLKASEVSKFWNFVANHDVLWHSVKLTNCRITNCIPFVVKLIKHGTKELDLDIKMHPSSIAYTIEHMTEILKPVTTLKKLTITTAFVKNLQLIAKHLPHLEGLKVPFVIGHCFDLTPLTTYLKNLKELKLNSLYLPQCIGNTLSIRKLTKLRKLSLSQMAPSCMEVLLENLPNSVTSLQLDFGYDYLDISLLSKMKNLSKLDLSDVILKNVKLFQNFRILKYLKLTSKFCVDCTDLLPYLPQSLVYLEIYTFEIVSIRRDVDLGHLSRFDNLSTVKLFGPRASITVKNASSLLSLKNLRVLSFEGVMNLESVVGFLPKKLLSLTLSDSFSLPEDFPTAVLPNLVHLSSLKLYSVRCESFKSSIITAALKLQKLNNLEIF